MLLHPVTLTALLCPLVAYLLCRRLGLLDPLILSMLQAAAWSFGGLLMWLRSRYIASLYLNERQQRNTAFLTSVRRDVERGHLDAGVSLREEKEHAQSQRPDCPRTVARLAPVLPAFIACCFFLVSFYCLMAAVLFTIWYVRSEHPNPY